MSDFNFTPEDRGWVMKEDQVMPGIVVWLTVAVLLARDFHAGQIANWREVVRGYRRDMARLLGGDALPG